MSKDIAGAGGDTEAGAKPPLIPPVFEPSLGPMLKVVGLRVKVIKHQRINTRTDINICPELRYLHSC